MKKNINAGLHSDLPEPVSFKLGVRVMPVMTLTFTEGHSIERIELVWLSVAKVSPT